MTRPGAAVLLAALLALAAPAAAQDLRPIRGRDTTGVDAVNVHELVARLRPEWLHVGGDPADPASWPRVRVFRSGAAQGGLEALRLLPVEGLVSVRLAGPRTALARDPRTPPDAAATLLVAYAAEAAARPWEAAVGVARRSPLRDRAWRSLAEAGWDRAQSEDVPWTEDLAEPVTLFASASLNLRPRLGISASVLHTGDQNVRGLAPPVPPSNAWLIHSTWFRTDDVAATAFTRAGLLRVGAGPAVRVLHYRHARQACECLDPRGGRRVVGGATAEAALAAPRGGPVRMTFLLAARWFPAHAIPGTERVPDMEMGGVTAYAGLGAAVGF